MCDPWEDMQYETATDAIAVRIETQVQDLVAIMEDTLSWYDHVACSFLICSDSKSAGERIKQLMQIKDQPREKWKKIILTPLLSDETVNGNFETLWLQLVETLHELNYNKLIEMRNLTYPIGVESLDPFRLKLFRMIDNMSKEEAAEMVQQLNTKFQHKINYNREWPTESYFLEWIDSNDITKENWDFPERPEKSIVADACISAQAQSLASAAKFVVEKPPELRKFTVRSGLCVIINQVNFYVDYQLSEELLKRSRGGLLYRYGSDTDRDSLSEVFKTLGFEVQVYENLTYEAILRTLKSISKTDFSKYDGFVMCILSHGDRNVIYTTDSIPLPLDIVKAYFDGVNCPALVNKPKLFFMQACQGARNAPVVELEHDGSLSAYANFFEAWATVPGFLSYRSTIAGAIFVQNLVWALQHHGHKLGLFDLMALVNARVGVEEVTRLGSKQISWYTSSLTGTVEFKRNKDKLVAAIVDNIERQLFHATLIQTAQELVRTRPKVVMWLLRTYGY